MLDYAAFGTQPYRRIISLICQGMYCSYMKVFLACAIDVSLLFDEHRLLHLQKWRNYLVAKMVCRSLFRLLSHI